MHIGEAGLGPGPGQGVVQGHALVLVVAAAGPDLGVGPDLALVPVGVTSTTRWMMIGEVDLNPILPRGATMPTIIQAAKRRDPNLGLPVQGKSCLKKSKLMTSAITQFVTYFLWCFTTHLVLQYRVAAYIK